MMLYAASPSSHPHFVEWIAQFFKWTHEVRDKSQGCYNKWVLLQGLVAQCGRQDTPATEVRMLRGLRMVAQLWGNQSSPKVSSAPAATCI